MQIPFLRSIIFVTSNSLILSMRCTFIGKNVYISDSFTSIYFNNSFMAFTFWTKFSKSTWNLFPAFHLVLRNTGQVNKNMLVYSDVCFQVSCITLLYSFTPYLYHILDYKKMLYSSFGNFYSIFLMKMNLTSLSDVCFSLNWFSNSDL